MTNEKKDIAQSLQVLIERLSLPLTDLEKVEGWHLGLKVQFYAAVTEYLNKIKRDDFDISKEILPNFTRGLGWEGVTEGGLGRVGP